MGKMASPILENAAAAPAFHPKLARNMGWVGFGALVAIVGVAAVFRFAALDSIPPGWHHDEALMGVMASEVYRGVSRPIFFPQYLGQEPLYIYMAAGVEWLMGGNQDILPLRITSALTGVATVLLAYAMARALFTRTVGLITAALVGTSFWQVLFSRTAFRSITQPLLEALALWLLWLGRNYYLAGRRGRSILCLMLSGVALGGTIYTYLGGRAFPIVFLLFGAWLFWRYRPRLFSGLRFVALVGVPTVLVMAPLSWYWLSHPGTFNARMQQISLVSTDINEGPPLVVFAAGVIKLLGTFTFNGAPLWHFNLPGRPIFVGLVAVFFYAGLVVLVRRAFQREDAAVAIVLWLVVMALPSVLSFDIGGYSVRAMGLAPALFVVPALGIAAVYDWACRTWSARPRLVQSFPIAIAVLLVIDAGWTSTDYFQNWAPSFGAAYESNADTVAEARYLAQLSYPESEYLVAGSTYTGHPVVAQLAPRVYDQLHWTDGSQSVVFPSQVVQPVRYVFSYSTLPAKGAFPEGSEVDEVPFSRGIDPGQPPPPLFVAYLLRPEQVRAQVAVLVSGTDMAPLGANLGGVVEAVAGGTAAAITQGSQLEVKAMWRVLRDAPGPNLTMYVHLLDSSGQSWAQSDANGYGSEQWRAGDFIWSRYRLDIPRTLPPGQYRVEVGVYDRNTVRRLEPAGAALPQIGPVRVLRSKPLTLADIGTSVGASFEEQIELLGQMTKVGAAEIDATLFWRARATSHSDYTVFVQLLDATGKLVAQLDSPPASGQLPSSSWQPGEIIADLHKIPLPAGLASGRYRLIAGMYQPATGARLGLIGGGDFVSLGELSLP